MNVGIIADLHEPFTHPMYQRFILDTFEMWDVNRIHFIGDVADNHALNMIEDDPDADSANAEANAAKVGVKKWYTQFPRATVSIGNHDTRLYRRAKKAGIPKRYIKSYKTVWETPGWDWDIEHIIDGVLYEHGNPASGKTASLNRSMERRMSVVMGHVHSWAGVQWHTNPTSRIFGMNVGCGIDIDAYAFDYGRVFTTRPVLGCGIVIDGLYPYFEPMPCGPKEKYHRSRA